jgi:inorganic pyrophosphatase
MKALFVGCTFFLLYACGNSGSVENADIVAPNYLHDIAPFTSDSLVHVVIEIPAGTNQKWELNKVTGRVEWERITADSLRIIDYLPYPANYGFVPQTLLPEASGGDGDPVDVFILGPSIDREEIVKARIIGMIHMLDDGELDSKLLAVDVNNPHGFNVKTYEMLLNEYPGALEIIKMWLLNYKGTDRVKILSVNDEKDAIHTIKTAHIDYIDQKN